MSSARTRADAVSREPGREAPLEFVVCEDDFVRAVGRPPRDGDEFDVFVHRCRRGLEAQIDWSVIFTCASECLAEEGRPVGSAP